MFSHEALSFLFLYYVFLFCRAFRNKLLPWKDFAIVSCVITCLAAISLLLAVANPGGERIAQQICERLVNSGLNANVCNGAIWWLTQRASDGIGLVEINIATYHYLEVYFLFFVLSIMPFLAFELPVDRRPCDHGGENDQWHLIRWTYLLFLAGTLLSIPLFVVTVDWGRWICFQFTTLFDFIHGDVPWSSLAPRGVRRNHQKSEYSYRVGSLPLLWKSVLGASNIAAPIRYGSQ